MCCYPFPYNLSQCVVPRILVRDGWGIGFSCFILREPTARSISLPFKATPESAEETLGCRTLCFPRMRFFSMRKPLRRYYGWSDLHFVTFSCYRRRPYLATRRARDCFVKVLEQVRGRLKFPLIGYVVMPEHVHLLIGEPDRGDPSKVLQVLKQKVSRLLRAKSRKLAHGQLALKLARKGSTPSISGRGVFMTSTYGARRNLEKNWNTCTQIPSSGNWLPIRATGRGAVGRITKGARMD
jgi:REP element-mobilizing transposase RayT